jgi:hypothetical protein
MANARINDRQMAMLQEHLKRTGMPVSASIFEAIDLWLATVAPAIPDKQQQIDYQAIHRNVVEHFKGLEAATRPGFAGDVLEDAIVLGADRQNDPKIE